MTACCPNSSKDSISEMAGRRIIRGHLPCTNLFRQAGNYILMLAVVKEICRLKRVAVQIKELALVLIGKAEFPAVRRDDRAYRFLLRGRGVPFDKHVIPRQLSALHKRNEAPTR